MPPQSSRAEKPDETRDVIVHYIQIIDASTGEKRDTWTVWLGLDKQADCTTLEEAAHLALQLAKTHDRPAWLLDESGYPLKSVVVGGPSEVTIEKEGQTQTYPFGSGLASGEIVNTILAQENLSELTQPFIQDALIFGINQIEKSIKDSERKETVDEHSFKINLGVFSYEFKRRIVKKN